MKAWVIFHEKARGLSRDHLKFSGAPALDTFNQSQCSTAKSSLWKVHYENKFTKTLDLIIFCIYSLNFSLEGFFCDKSAKYYLVNSYNPKYKKNLIYYYLIETKLGTPI